MTSTSPLFELLRCPVTMQRLQEAPQSLVMFLEDERLAGRLMDDSGNVVVESVEKGFIREDGLAFYPIRNGIPNMVQAILVR